MCPGCLSSWVLRKSSWVSGFRDGPGNFEEYFQSHGEVYQENMQKVQVLETFAPALPIYAMLLTAIRKLVGSLLVMASDEEPAVQSKTQN